MVTREIKKGYIAEADKYLVDECPGSRTSRGFDWVALLKRSYIRRWVRA